MNAGMKRGALATALGLTLVLTMTAPAFAQQDSNAEKAPGPISVEDAKGFLGDWTISIDFNGNERELPLKIMDADGSVVAMLRFGPEATKITDIKKTAEGIRLSYEAEFGQNQLNLFVDLTLDGGNLAGKLGDESGLFSATLTGVPGEEVFTEADLNPDEADLEAQEARRDRRRRSGRMGRANLTLAGKRVSLSFGRPKVDGPSFGQIESAPDGTVIRIVEQLPLKLQTHIDLKFGDTIIEYGNQAENYPGTYTLWLKKSGGGWSLVFNSEADVWGTMHNPEADVAEVPLEFGPSEETLERLEVELTDAGDGAGLLRLAWGPHQWTTSFTAVVD